MLNISLKYLHILKANPYCNLYNDTYEKYIKFNERKEQKYRYFLIR